MSGTEPRETCFIGDSPRLSDDSPTKLKPPCPVPSRAVPSRSWRIWEDYSPATLRTRRANAAFTGCAIASLPPPVRRAHANLQPGLGFSSSPASMGSKWRNEKKKGKTQVGLLRVHGRESRRCRAVTEALRHGERSTDWGGWMQRPLRCSWSCARTTSPPQRADSSWAIFKTIFSGNMGQEPVEPVGTHASSVITGATILTDKRFKRPGPHITALPALCAPSSGVTFTLCRLDGHSLTCVTTNRRRQESEIPPPPPPPPRKTSTVLRATPSSPIKRPLNVPLTSSKDTFMKLSRELMQEVVGLRPETTQRKVTLLIWRK